MQTENRLRCHRKGVECKTTKEINSSKEIRSFSQQAICVNNADNNAWLCSAASCAPPDGSIRERGGLAWWVTCASSASDGRLTRHCQASAGCSLCPGGSCYRHLVQSNCEFHRSCRLNGHSKPVSTWIFATGEHRSHEPDHELHRLSELIRRIMPMRYDVTCLVSMSTGTHTNL